MDITYTAKVFVEQFDVSVYDLEDCELVVTLLYGAAEVETGVALVHYLEVLPLEERAHLWLPRQHRRYDFPRHLLFLPLMLCREPLG